MLLGGGKSVFRRDNHVVEQIGTARYGRKQDDVVVFKHKEIGELFSQVLVKNYLPRCIKLAYLFKTELHIPPPVVQKDVLRSY